MTTQLKPKPFRVRGAILQNIEGTARAWAKKNNTPVNVYRVNGGYEARPDDQGAPKGSNEFLHQIVPPGFVPVVDKGKQKTTKATKTAKTEIDLGGVTS